MANKIATVCKYPLCGKINCTNPAHQAQPKRRPFTRKPDPRPSASRRGYDARWRKVRARHLKQSPYCEDCGRPATDVDHIPDRVELVAKGVPDPDAEQYLHSRCHSCHSKKTHSKKTFRRDKPGRGG